MRTTLFVIALALGITAATGPARAQAKAYHEFQASSFQPNDDVYLNLVAFLYGTPSLGYEHALSRDNSFTGEIGFRGISGSGYSITYLGLGGSYRWWLAEHSKLRGFFLGPKGYLMNLSVSYDLTPVGGTKSTATGSSAFVGLGGEGGYQWIFPNGLLLNAGAEAIYYLGSLSLQPDAPSVPLGGLGIGLKGSVGYAF